MSGLREETFHSYCRFLSQRRFAPRKDRQPAGGGPAGCAAGPGGGNRYRRGMPGRRAGFGPTVSAKTVPVARRRTMLRHPRCAPSRCPRHAAGLAACLARSRSGPHGGQCGRGAALGPIPFSCRTYKFSGWIRPGCPAKPTTRFGQVPAVNRLARDTAIALASNLPCQQRPLQHFLSLRLTTQLMSTYDRTRQIQISATPSRLAWETLLPQVQCPSGPG